MKETCENCPTKRCFSARVFTDDYSVPGRVELTYSQGKVISTLRIPETIRSCVSRHEAELGEKSTAFITGGT